jgi:transcriptional regulator GlxA family with amidase domain
MNSNLNYVQNWTELAQHAKWSTSALAKQCSVSVRTLERYFHAKFDKCPRTWIAEQREQRAIELLRKGYTVKETAVSLGYQHPTNFSRKFPTIRTKIARI